MVQVHYLCLLGYELVQSPTAHPLSSLNPELVEGFVQRLNTLQGKTRHGVH